MTSIGTIVTSQVPLDQLFMVVDNEDGEWRPLV